MPRLMLRLCPLVLLAIGGCSCVAPNRAGDPSSAARDAELQRQRQKIVGDSAFWIACDFATDVWQNGQRVPLGQRRMQAEIYGRTIERDQFEIRQGDWLVFQLARNPLRENGARLFMFTLLKDNEPVLKSDDSAIWSCISDPKLAAGFIRSYQSPSESAVSVIPPNQRWNDGYRRFQQAYGNLGAEPIWGDGTVVWIKLRIPRSGERQASAQ